MSNSPPKDTELVNEIAQPKNLSISIRLSSENVVDGLRPEDFLLYERTKIHAWRLPACYKEQVNLPGYFWVSQTKQFIFYESRLEMSILKYLDFDESFNFVLPQPFRISFDVNGKQRFHVPDFLIWRKYGTPLLVNVKPKRFVNDPHSAESFAACNELSKTIQVEHRIQSELDEALHKNIRWLAGFRRVPYMFENISKPLLSRLEESKTMSFADWIKGIDPEELVRPVAFHLIWKKLVTFDRDSVISSNSLISAVI